MRLKSFTAGTMTEAMQMVRDSLGEEAVIVASREEKPREGRKGGVRVTAAIDPSYEEAHHDDMFNDSLMSDNSPTYDDAMFLDRAQAETPTPKTQSARTWLQYDDENESAAIVEDITDGLLRHAVSEEVMDQILSCATVVGMESADEALTAAIEHLFPFTPLPQSAHSKALMMVGPPGSGKTLAVAKMAARGVMNGLNVGVVSCDTIRAGGIEQLRAFTDLLRIDLLQADNPKTLSAALASMRGYDQILIDMAGINPFDADDVKTLARMIGAEDVDPLLVLPAGIDAEESGETARVFSTIGVETMIPTRIDIARRIGGLLSAAHQGHLSFADMSNTPKVANGLQALSPESMARLILPSAFRKNTEELRKQRIRA
ncbi:MAG: GTPase [Alphaproteobacteria bacterium]